LRRFFAHPATPLGWLVLSLSALLTARAFDPYVFGFGAFAAAPVSALLVLATLIAAPRRVVLALLAAAPTAVSFHVLSSYHWA
jgi:hypothetical protein